MVHSGNEFTTQADWTEYDNKIKEQACIKDRSDAITQNKSGKYTYGPTPGPDPCGKVVWLCEGAEYNSESDYKSTSCGQPKKNTQPKGVANNERCARFVVSPMCPNNPYGFPAMLPPDAPECNCK